MNGGAPDDCHGCDGTRGRTSNEAAICPEKPSTRVPSHPSHATGTFIAPVRTRRDMGFWSGLEGRLVALQQDRPRMARYMQIAWYVSNAFLILGVVLIFLLATGRWRP